MVVPGGVFKQVQNCGDGKHEAYTLPTPAGAGHLWTESINAGCNQWLS